MVKASPLPARRKPTAKPGHSFLFSKNQTCLLGKRGAEASRLAPAWGGGRRRPRSGEGGGWRRPEGEGGPPGGGSVGGASHRRWAAPGWGGGFVLVFLLLQQLHYVERWGPGGGRENQRVSQLISPKLLSYPRFCFHICSYSFTHAYLCVSQGSFVIFFAHLLKMKRTLPKIESYKSILFFFSKRKAYVAYAYVGWQRSKYRNPN